MLIYLGEHCIFSRHDRSENTGHSLRVRESHFWLVDLEDLVSVVSIPHFEVDYTEYAGFLITTIPGTALLEAYCRAKTINISDASAN
jgi:hypothetical protein